jgi:hypothetical protein
MDSGYRGLYNEHPEQVDVPPKKPAKDPPPEVIAAYESERLIRAAGLAAQEDGFDPGKAAGFRSVTVDRAEMPF